MSTLCDLHCHMLPGIDDGAQTPEEARALLEASAGQGVSRLVFTPHFYPERMTAEEFLRDREAAVQTLRPYADALGIEFRVGAEIQITPFLAELPLEKFAFSGTRYLLLELLFWYEPFDVLGLIHRLREKGYTPILAHVERYPYVEEDPELLYRWVKAGALAQVNAGWLLHDDKAKKRIALYDRWNLVHVVASDAHSMETRPQNLERGYAALKPELAGKLQANARAIFDGKAPDCAAPVKPERRFGRWR